MTLDRTAPPVSDAMIAALARQLRLPEGFPTAPETLADLREALVAAIEAVEARTARILSPRRLTARTARWREDGRWAFPAGPARAVVALTLHGRDGATAVDPTRLRIEPGAPARLSGAPAIPCGGFAEIVYEAGYGGAWKDAPGDLRQAAMALAAAIFDGRPAQAAQAVAALTAPYRPVRL